MNNKLQSFFALMFNKEDSVCVSNSQFSYHSIPLSEILTGAITLISPNQEVPARKVECEHLILVSLNPIKGFRNDKNCYTFRNFLIELDNYDRDLQIGYIKKLGIPYSSIVWSGSKSAHVLISLSEDLTNEKIYRDIYKWMLNIASLSDQALGNPSRSIRIPGAIRPETGKEQELIEMGGRISHKELFDWLNQYEHLRPKAREKKVLTGQGDFDRLSPWARWQLKKGIQFAKGRNATWYALAVDFAKAGYTEDQTTEILEKHFQEEHDFKEKEWLRTIRSGFEYVNNER
jgi:hypothetical protein